MGYAAVRDQGIYDLVERANTARIGGVEDETSRAAEAVCREVFGADERVAVYGPLAPGEARHYMLAPLRGAWTTGFVRGRLEQGPWTALLGAPGLRIDGGSERVPVHVLQAAMLEQAWAAFAPFRSAGFARLLAPIEDGDGVASIANVFALKE